VNAHERRLEDRALLTRGGTYVADVRDDLLRGAAWVHFVRSDVAHGDIVRIGAGEARAAPGVLGVFTADDVDIGPMPPVLPRFDPGYSAPILAEQRVRYVGEPVVAVVASSPSLAADAAELVEIDIGTRSPVIDLATSLLGDDIVGRAGVSNLVSEMSAGSADPDTMFDGCDVVVRTEMRHARVSACPMEPRAAASVWHEGRLHHWVSTQGPHSVKRVLAATLGCDESSVRVVAPDVGGGFGPKFSNYPEDVFVAWVARRLDCPVRWNETRRESMVGLHHGRARQQIVTIGGRRDGTITAYRLEVVQDAGAYASLGAYAPEATLRMTTGVYRIARAHATARAVLTNTTPVSALRGTGRPEATCAIERSVDRFAQATGIDPVDVRLRNMVPSEAMPYETAVGTVYDSGDYTESLRRACELAELADLRAEQAVRRKRRDPRQIGIGTCSYVESTAAGPAMEFATVVVHSSGDVTVSTGSSPHGQGHVTTWTALAAARLGVATDRVSVALGDTDVVAAGLGTFASRSTQLAGSALATAIDQLVARARLLSAELLEANRDDVVFDPVRGTFFVAGSPQIALGWADLAKNAGSSTLREDAMFMGAMTFPFGSHVSVVEVDVETGRVVVLRHIAVDDAGILVNRTLAEGQVHGGIANGVGEALLEAVLFDDDGTPLTTNLADYAVPTASDLPNFEVSFTETPAPSNPIGAKGIGESGTIGAVAAIQNAVCDALAPFGVEHVDLPMSPERVWRAVRRASVHAEGLSSRRG
jgi:carbon-monoxide dehydrogenase large subunit